MTESSMPTPERPRPSIPAALRDPERVITIVLVAFATGFVIWNLRPALWFDNTTPTGGDMGAHVWSPAYLRDVLLPDLRLTGWSPDWYAGFPAFTFYMIIPSLLVVIVNVGIGGGPVVPVLASGLIAVGSVRARQQWGGTIGRAIGVYGVAALVWLLVVPVPYGVAMKLVVVAGMVTLPVAAWAAGRLGGLAFPGPALLAVMTLPFLFDRSYNIYGGNLMSTMAGEFAYSLALTMAVVAIGVAARGLDTGRHRALAGALLALAGLTHLFAAFFAMVAIGALWLVQPGRRTTAWVAVTGTLAGALAAFWVLPFFANRALLNDMGWGKERRYVAALWDRSGEFGDQSFLANDPPLQLLVILAVIGAVLCGLRRVRFGMGLSLTAVFFALAFLLLPEGRLWNVRLLPFYYLTVNLLAGIAIAETGRLLVVAFGASNSTRRALTSAAPAILTTLVLFVSLGLPLRSLPGGSLDDTGRYSWLGFSTTSLNLGPSWINHNFSGYEGQAAYPEYASFVATMAAVGETHGCGRALWEYESGRLGSYGTPMAPMLLPHWTDGCIGSMEGLYFEASATTPYHFLLQSELSNAPSRAQRDLPYSGLSISQGVRHLQDLGVRYYAAFSDQAVIQAQAEPRLTELATAGPWVIFEVADTALVVGLDHLPVVVDGVQGGGENWLVPSVAWWEAENVPLIAADGPDAWPRTSIAEIEAGIPALQQAVENDTGRVAEMQAMAANLSTVLPDDPVDPVVVTDVRTSDSSIAFSVDRPGQPVLVKTSYFPNWDVSGADGPYRVAPNLMVVVPTDTEVTLTYGRSGVEILALLLSFAGIIAMFALGRLPDAGDGELWDLTRRPTDHFPDRAVVLDEVRAGTAEPDWVRGLGVELAARWRDTLTRTGGAVLVVAGTLLAHVVVSPGADEPVGSLLVWLPGIVATVALAFVLVPSLVDLWSYRVTVLDPAGLAVGVEAPLGSPASPPDDAPVEPDGGPDGDG